MISYTHPDLTQHPPRSARVRLGGFVHLARLLDKCRALNAGKLGEYVFPCPLDKRFFGYVGIDAQVFLSEVKTGKSDTEMVAWMQTKMNPLRLPHEIEAWSNWLEKLGPGDAQRHAGFADTLREVAPGRDDIRTNFERLDLDDYVTFGGKA